MLGVPGGRRGDARNAQTRAVEQRELGRVQLLSSPSVLFLHGWGVGPGAYREPLRRLEELGCSVVAPSLPGFGAVPALAARDHSFAGFAGWLARHLQRNVAQGPFTVVGHSFGGGVALQLAHDHPSLVRSLVLCNAVGGPAQLGPGGHRPMAQRPWWEWGRIGVELLNPPNMVRVLPAVLPCAVPNLLHHPLVQWRVAEFARKADLLAETAAVASSQVPITVVWSDRDRISPHAGFVALAEAAKSPGVVVPGHHNWLITEPRRFADVVLRSMVDSGVLDDVLPVRAAS